MERSLNANVFWTVLLVFSLAGIAWLNRGESRDVTQRAEGIGHAHADDDKARGTPILAHPLAEVVRVEFIRKGRTSTLSLSDLGATPAAEATRTGKERAVQAIAMMSRMRMERQYDDSPTRAAEFGMGTADNDLTLRWVLGDGESVSARFGALAPDGISRYVRVSPPGKLATVPDFQYRNARDLAIWAREGRWPADPAPPSHSNASRR